MKPSGTSGSYFWPCVCVRVSVWQVSVCIRVCARVQLRARKEGCDQKAH